MPQSGDYGLWFEFVRHLEFLRSEGYVDAAGRLTSDGHLASQLRLNQPVLIAEAIRHDVLPIHQPALLAALLAWLADGREAREHPPSRMVAELEVACRQVGTLLQPLLGRLREWGFEGPPLPPASANAVYAWGQMVDLVQVSELYGGGEGDVAQLIYRVADNLRQLFSLASTHPRLVACARQALELMIRPPILLPE